MALLRLLQRRIPRKLWRTERLKKDVLVASDNVVVSGPFAGMKYLSESVGSTYVPKILGTYEQELHLVIEGVVALQPTLVLNIGAAEGYYAAGLARRLPQARIKCWEISALGQKLIGELFEANDICAERTSIDGFCSMTALRDALDDINPREATLAIVDIEGGEALLLDPVILPRLAHCHLLVEVHEFAIPGVEPLIIGRFSGTHAVERIAAMPRSIEDWPLAVSNLVSARLEGAACALLCEARPANMSWLYLQPRTDQVIEK